MAYGLTQSANLATASTQYFTAADSASVSPTGNMTFEAWIKPTSTGLEKPLLTKAGDSGNTFSYYLFMASGGGVECAVSENGGFGAGNVVEFNGGTGFVADTWQHIAMVFTASTGKLEVFRNAVSIGSNTVGTVNSIFDSAGAFRLGVNRDYNAGFDGRISLARLWSTARTSTELADNMCVVYGTATTGVLAEWSLNNVLTDASGNGNTLTNNNSATFVTDVPTVCAPVANSNFFLFFN